LTVININDFFISYSFPKMKEVNIGGFRENFLELSLVPNIEKLFINCYKDETS